MPAHRAAPQFLSSFVARGAVIVGLALAPLGAQAPVSLDDYPWHLGGCASVGTDLTLAVCGPQCSSDLSTASVVIVQPGTLVFDVRSSVAAPNPFTTLHVSVDGQLVHSIDALAGGPTWCAPTPCVGSALALAVDLEAGAELSIVLDGAEVGCGFPGGGATTCTLEHAVFTPKPGISVGPGKLDAALLASSANPLSTYTEFGAALAWLPDRDGDLVPELAIGAPYYQIGTPSGAGRVYVCSGAQPSQVLEQHTGTFGDGKLGTRIIDAGDLDGDGVGDLVASAPSTSGAIDSKGRVYAWSGATGAQLWMVTGSSKQLLGSGLAACGDVDLDGTPDVLAGAPGTNTFDGALSVLAGADGAALLTLASGVDNAFLGAAVAGPGDLDADGIPDLLAGAPRIGVTTPLPGSVHAYAGASGAALFSLDGPAVGSSFGASVVAAGDLDGDGAYDFAVGAPHADPAQHPSAAPHGRVSAYSGATHALLYELSGAGNEQLGGELAAAGDVDGDGRDDLLVGSAGGGAGGRCIVLGGASGALLLERVHEHANAAFGFAVAGAHDVDGDGSVDFAVSAPFETGASGDKAGCVWLFSGVPAAHVAPRLSAHGSLQGGAPFTLSITHATPAANAWIVVGADHVDLPLLGGLLVPSVGAILDAPLDALGAYTLAFAWPSGLPSGLSVWMQAWIATPAAPLGFTATNSLVLATP